VLQQQVRAATTTFLLIVSTYLASNILQFAVTIWEFFDTDSLFRNCEFYMLITDVISLLSVCVLGTREGRGFQLLDLQIIGCVLRLPTYLVSNAELRRVICQTCSVCANFKAVRLAVLAFYVKNK
jgi:hypothetical protein